MQISEEQYNKLPERLQKHFYHGNFHCTVKPIKLLEYFVKLITPPNGIVIDPFMGSASTCLACINLDKKFIGIELEKASYDIAVSRVKKHLEGEVK
jgi:site-specific DNA-methyltransferase (adenine-specific)